MILYKPDASDGFTLADLKEKTGLNRCIIAWDIDSVFDHILPKGPGGHISYPLIIGIDGSVAAGKTFYSSNMCHYLQRRSFDSIVIHCDWFMTSREKRAAEIQKARNGLFATAFYDQMNCDFKRIADLLKKIFLFLKSGSDNELALKLEHLYDRNTGQLDGAADLRIRKDSVVIFEGTGILNADISDYFDASVRIDIDDPMETIRRLRARETQKGHEILDDAFIEERYNLVDRPYDDFLRLRDIQYFDVLLDTTNLNLIKIYPRNH